MSIQWIKDPYQPTLDATAHSDVFDFKITGDGRMRIFYLETTLKFPAAKESDGVSFVVTQKAKSMRKAKAYAESIVSSAEQSLSHLRGKW